MLSCRVSTSQPPSCGHHRYKLSEFELSRDYIERARTIVTRASSGVPVEDVAMRGGHPIYESPPSHVHAHAHGHGHVRALHMFMCMHMDMSMDMYPHLATTLIWPPP